MNYGYTKDTPGYDVTREGQLVDALEGAIARHKEQYPDDVKAGGGPYVEWNGPYGGVRVRRITHMEHQDEFVEELDRVYESVMLSGVDVVDGQHRA